MNEGFTDPFLQSVVFLFIYLFFIQAMLFLDCDVRWLEKRKPRKALHKWL